MGKAPGGSWMGSPLPVLPPPPPPYQPIRIRNKTLPLTPHPLLPGAGEHGGSEAPSPRSLAVPCRAEDYHKFPETPWQSRPCLHNHLVPTTRSPTEHGWLLRNFHLQINPRAITRPCKQAAGPHSGGAWGSMRMHGGPLLGQAASKGDQSKAGGPKDRGPRRCSWEHGFALRNE